ncbi:hypothetical protein, partial [Streptomyces drozdowiczii]|uniref:hypothetical protein n=1 Tax=Streptomyces drozdowiczii TaxID=202862 RepID=UPI002248497D
MRQNATSLQMGAVLLRRLLGGEQGLAGEVDAGQLRDGVHAVTSKASSSSGRAASSGRRCGHGAGRA